jgi:arsenate reductase
MAEALARKLSNRPNIEFVSMGTHPAREVDPKVLEVLREANIIWQGKPKGIQDKEPIDVVVTMGCEVECPVIPGAKRIDWDIPDPKGKDTEDYRKTLAIIKEKVKELLKEVD